MLQVNGEWQTPVKYNNLYNTFIKPVRKYTHVNTYARYWDNHNKFKYNIPDTYSESRNFKASLCETLLSSNCDANLDTYNKKRL